MVGMFRKILGGGDSNERVLKGLAPLVEQVNALEPEVQPLSDDALRAKTDEFRARYDAGETLDDLLPEAFAVVREAIRRATGGVERAYDVQIMGAVTLHRGQIAEMRTGEGKTLVATIAMYLNALSGEGIHAVTVNDYLARRDAQWYAPALDALGLTIGVIQNGGAAYRYSAEVVSDEGSFEHLVPVPRREAYVADVTYGTNNEFGFDYLRDNLATTMQGRSQRGRAFAIVDEADSVLIDEARTPLIISGASQDDTSVYPRFARIVPQLEEDRHYTVDLRHRAVALTEAGVEHLERALGVENIYSLENFRLTRYMEAALKAHVLFHRDRDYVVKDGEIIIVDDFTGRLMEGRRWSDGLHQAVEAKEGVQIQRESVTYATITLQNYFRLYDKLAGMTGTAATEAEELSEIYELEVVVMPTHREIAREDFSDLVYRSQRGKWGAVLKDIAEKNAAGRPVLVGTVVIETSEMLSAELKKAGIDHEVLNAKQHQREASIISRAGQPGAVTIATNMAGRGTDIKLGAGVAEAGGLHVIGTERHESRRIDNQLRGRSGRQGDPGSTRFFVSFEDDLMKRFAPDWLPGMMQKLGMDDSEALESKMVTRAIEQAQQRVEGHNFDIRKRLVEYDDVINQQRTVVYNERDKVLRGESMKDTVLDMFDTEVEALGETHFGEAPDPAAFRAAIEQMVPDVPADALSDELRSDDAIEEAKDLIEERYEQIEEEFGEDSVRLLERLLLLRAIDMMWVEHLTAAEELRQGIGLRALAQQDPLVVYKHEAHDMWTQFRERIRQVVTRQIFRTRLTTQAVQAAQQEQAPKQVTTSGPGEPGEEGGRTAAAPVTAGVAMPVPDENASRADRRRYERALQKAEKRKGKRG
ncbi:MAG: preprotein translocase subunit SecA [Chloroflexi bacterium]|nr:preprotein translocase subunit SecA [Chloroflexota bacterium]